MAMDPALQRLAELLARKALERMKERQRLAREQQQKLPAPEQAA